MLNILFVDDDSFVLAGLRRQFRKERDQWSVQFAESGQEALLMMESAEIDVIVSDLRMPEIDGAQLLEIVRERFPRVIRIILSGHSEDELRIRGIEAAHHCLAKPCDTDLLKSVISDSCRQS